MRNLRTIITTVLLALLFNISAGAQEYFMHTVTQGQGLYSISRMYGVTEDEIIRLNPGSEKVIPMGSVEHCIVCDCAGASVAFLPHRPSDSAPLRLLDWAVADC